MTTTPATTTTAPPLTIERLTSLHFYYGFFATLSALRPMPGRGVIPAKLASEIFSERLKSGIETYVGVIYSADTITGYPPMAVATASLIFERKFLHGGALAAHLEDVAVHRDYQGRGYGSEIVRYAVGRARERGAYKLILDASDDRAASFYKRMGFEPTGERNFRMNLTGPSAGQLHHQPPQTREARNG